MAKPHRAFDPPQPPGRARRWRDRAEEIRTVAEVMHNAEMCAVMQRIAADYEEMARLAEQGLVKE